MFWMPAAENYILSRVGVSEASAIKHGVIIVDINLLYTCGWCFYPALPLPNSKKSIRIIGVLLRGLKGK